MAEMSIDQGNQGSTIPDLFPTVIAFYVSFVIYQDSVKFIMILMTPNLAAQNTYMYMI